MEDSSGQNINSAIDSSELKNSAGGIIRLAKFFFLLLCLETIFSLPYRSVFLLRSSALQATIAASCVLAVLVLCFVFSKPVLCSLGRVLRAQSIGNKLWFSFWLIFGLVLRLAWALRFPVALQSDNVIYFNVAVQMARGQLGASVFNPPGLSLFLAPFLMIFGAHPWVTLLCAQLMFIATYLLTYALAKEIQGGVAARIAPMLVAIWPCYFPLVSVNSKETLLAVLVPATLFLYLQSTASTLRFSIRCAYVVAAGLCMGFAALTQPGYLLFPAIIFAFELMQSTGVLKSAARTAIFGLAMLASVLPWTYRNYLTFHRVVLISTNGGSVFYRSNNALANGQYMPENSVSLPKDEFEADKLGYKLAEGWIEHHPAAFAELMVKKQIVYLGDDALGAFETLRRGAYPSGAFYASVKAVSNLFWLALWTVLFYAFPLLFKLKNWRLWYGLLFLPLLYQWTIDSVFESGPRHHVPYVAPIAVLVSLAIASAIDANTSSEEVTSQS